MGIRIKHERGIKLNEIWNRMKHELEFNVGMKCELELNLTGINCEIEWNMIWDWKWNKMKQIRIKCEIEWNVNCD